MDKRDEQGKEEIIPVTVFGESLCFYCTTIQGRFSVTTNYDEEFFNGTSEEDYGAAFDECMDILSTYVTNIEKNKNRNIFIDHTIDSLKEEIEELKA